MLTPKRLVLTSVNSLKDAGNKIYICFTVTQKLRFTFFIAALTASSIVLFQLYWLYYNYSNSERDFHNTAVHALEKSIEVYQAQQVELPTSLNYKKPSLTVFMRTKPSVEAFDLDTPKRKRVFNAEFSTVAIDKEHEPYVRALIARLMTQQMHKSVSLKVLTAVYQKELNRNGIGMPVVLTLRTKPLAIRPGEIASRIDYFKTPVVVTAKLNSSGWLLRHNLLPALVSLLLILLSAGSLWYMGVIIRRQLQLDRLKNDFISNITHELRTPLTILRSSNEAIAGFNVAAHPQKLARYTGINADIINKLENEIERILDISLLEHDRHATGMQETDLYALVKSVVDRYQVIGQNKIKFMGQDHKMLVHTAPYPIETILNNLLDNALKYAGPNASVMVNVAANPDSWQLTVSDTGIGINKEDLPYIFDKFYRVNTGDLHDVKGYGLGLSQVQGLVKAMNGKIKATSQRGRGTTFTLTFPI
jgi:two-component system phosphate regulon sensor histidine kinase PhoR